VNDTTRIPEITALTTLAELESYITINVATGSEIYSSPFQLIIISRPLSKVYFDAMGKHGVQEEIIGNTRGISQRKSTCLGFGRTAICSQSLKPTLEKETPPSIQSKRDCESMLNRSVEQQQPCTLLGMEW
jgi:hypothetical protein